MTGRLRGLTAIVTGSSGGGLGAEIARVFAREEACVIVTGRSADRGRAVADEILADGGVAAFISADLTSSDECRTLATRAADTFGRPVGVLVNSAVSLRTGDDGPIGSVPDDLWEVMFRVNVDGARNLIAAVLPGMLQLGRGSIVNVTSRTALRGTPNLAAYSASKGAIEALTRSIAMDYSRQGVRCNAVAPGFIMGKERVGEIPADRLALFQQMHLTRMPTTQDVANACLFFASDESGAITGVSLPVDGGGSAVRGLTLG